MYISQYPSEISVYDVNLFWQCFLTMFHQQISDVRPVGDSDKLLFSGVKPPPQK